MICLNRIWNHDDVECAATNNVSIWLSNVHSTGLKGVPWTLFLSIHSRTLSSHSRFTAKLNSKTWSMSLHVNSEYVSTLQRFRHYRICGRVASATSLHIRKFSDFCFCSSFRVRDSCRRCRYIGHDYVVRITLLCFLNASVKCRLHSPSLHFALFLWHPVICQCSVRNAHSLTIIYHHFHLSQLIVFHVAFAF